MTQPQPVAALSPRRAELASFDHAYAVAVQLRSHSGIDQFVVRTGSALQPFRITSQRPGATERILAMVA